MVLFSRYLLSSSDRLIIMALRNGFVSPVDSLKVVEIKKNRIGIPKKNVGSAKNSLVQRYS